ncbi:MAG: trypsin-like peptidase domain-containing protein [Cytophagales bacterium]|nr:trypsin-like peptidase domain-containing protein [Cytophagales bacterium]
MRRVLLTAIIGFSTGFLGLIVGAEWYKSEIISEIEQDTSAQFSNFRSTEDEPIISRADIPVDTSLFREDFVQASFSSTNSVVFIQTSTEYEYMGRSVFDWFFEPRSQQKVGSGSGVIFSKDGYIVTNNHVIEDADIIRVTVGKKIYDAELIGTDPSTDLAVIKVDDASLPAIALGKSSNVNVGEWVLAVGNPFNLTSTVTAGIVSAKGRNINILRDRFPIESFIQTDAAINPGNSGGALVNKKGELIGINTAILSRTGSYAGYGFAVPVDIVKKVYTDLVKYGQVQKALTGAEFLDIDSEIADKLELQSLQGVLIAAVARNSASEKAGLEKGDVILRANGKQVDSKANLEEYLAGLYPGDEIDLVVRRDDRTLNKNMTLTNREGTTGILRKVTYYSEDLQATFEALPKADREAYGVSGGIKVIEFDRRGFFARLDIPEGFIITSINGRPMDTPEELSELLSRIRGRVTIVGIDRNGRQVYFPYRF